MTYKEQRETCFKAGLQFDIKDYNTDTPAYAYSACYLYDNVLYVIARFFKCNGTMYHRVSDSSPGMAVMPFVNKNCVLGGEPFIKFIEQSKCEIKKEKIKKKLKEMQKDFQY